MSSTCIALSIERRLRCAWGLIYYPTIIIKLINRTSVHIFHIFLVLNCLSHIKISETVYSLSGFWNCLCWKGQTNGFYSLLTLYRIPSMAAAGRAGTWLASMAALPFCAPSLPHRCLCWRLGEGRSEKPHNKSINFVLPFCLGAVQCSVQDKVLSRKK